MAEGLVKLAAALAGSRLEGEHRHIRIVVLGIVTVPEETPLSQGASLVRAYRTMLRYIPQNGAADDNIEVQTEVRVAREVWQGILDQVEEEKGDLLLLHWKGSTQTPGKIYGDTIDAILANPPCDVVLARFNTGLGEIKNILLPVRGGSYSGLALTLASNLAEEWEAGITVLHSLSSSLPQTRPAVYGNNYDPGYPDGEDEPLAALQNLLVELPSGARLVTLQGSPVSGIVREARFHDLIVLGASEIKDQQARSDEQVVTEKVAERIAAETDRPLLVVKTRKPFQLIRPASEIKSAPAVREPDLEEQVDRWFAENTFHYREFRSMSSLTLLKERNNLSISLVIPVYGKIQPVALAEHVRRARYALMRDCALVDEIIVADPAATLDKAEVAAFLRASNNGHEPPAEMEIFHLTPESAGIEARHVPADNYSPAVAIWLALRKTRGDLIVWADPHMDGFEARLVYGLVGPLLSYPEFSLAAGFYSETDEGNAENSRPLYDSLVELALRPLLGGFYPTLAGVINPLCTVGAARRDHLERLPFFTGLAFMPALLADTLSRSGLMSIAQIDLGMKPHEGMGKVHQRATAEVLSMLVRRTEERSQGHILNNFNPAVKTVFKDTGVYSLKVEPPTSPQKELPPVAFTPGYTHHSFLDDAGED